MPTLRILSKQDIASAMSMKQAIRLMREGFISLSSGRAHAPVRMNLPIQNDGQRALFMPVFSQDLDQVGLKVVTVNPENHLHGLPFIHAFITVNDASTGVPLALMDGEYITSLRTGAGSGLATEILSRPDSSVLAIFGTGVQAYTQIEAVCAVRPIRHIIIFGRSPERTDHFTESLRDRYTIDIIQAKEPTDLAEADIVCTATTSLTPVFSAEHLTSGTHINGIGSYRPDMREIPDEVIAKAKVVVDQRDACLHEAGDLTIPIQNGIFDASHIHAELGEILLHHQKGRTSNSEITFFKSVGNAIQDLVIASFLVNTANQVNLGTEVDL